jgi:uncharacterized membrane protein
MALINQGDLEDKAGVKAFIVIAVTFIAVFAALLVLKAPQAPPAPRLSEMPQASQEPQAAYAGLRICNKTSSRVSVAIGYKEVGKDWVTEGWWNTMPGGCEALLGGPLHGKFYYVYAIDSDRGGEWSGQHYMCTQNKMFTINGAEDCEKRGFIKKGFQEIDTGELQTWVIQLDESGRTGLK